MHKQANLLTSKTNKKAHQASSVVTKGARKFGEWIADEVSDGKAYAKRQAKKGESFVEDKAKEIKSGIRKETREIKKPVKHWLDLIKFKIPDRN